ncbi:MAG: hypothetical protein EXS36_01190 [Pedosphaera sp.]|nr:hypothetical protein [Pedosphaera sp.]
MNPTGHRAQECGVVSDHMLADAGGDGFTQARSGLSAFGLTFDESYFGTVVPSEGIGTLLKVL